VGDKPNLGISSCLLGANVRYDGGHKLDPYLRDALGPLVNWIPVCPEVECGLPVLRESMRLVGDLELPGLVTERSGIDHTERMLRWTESRLENLDKMDIGGFVFKTRSPSCGMRDIQICDKNGKHRKKGSGLFARKFMIRFPCLPVEDEGRLNDPDLRENFIERIIVCRRWSDFMRNRFSMNGFIAFHTDHKLLIMSHSPKHLSELGRITASSVEKTLALSAGLYLETLMAALKLFATVKKNVNVLQHAMGYLKKVLSTDEKLKLRDAIGQYQQSRVPLAVPKTLIKYNVRKYEEPYLKRQLYLNPQPVELTLMERI
jgi:uncharacterized protein YbgA (DUF1722 family)/uncharacterized protein YbbK (DUF523 family)